MKIIHRNPILLATCPACPFFESRELSIRPSAAVRVIKFCTAFETEITTGDVIPEFCLLSEATKEEEKLYGASQPVPTR